MSTTLTKKLPQYFCCLLRLEIKVEVEANTEALHLLTSRLEAEVLKHILQSVVLSGYLTCGS